MAPPHSRSVRGREQAELPRGGCPCPTNQLPITAIIQNHAHHGQTSHTARKHMMTNNSFKTSFSLQNPCPTDTLTRSAIRSPTPFSMPRWRAIPTRASRVKLPAPLTGLWMFGEITTASKSISKRSPENHSRDRLRRPRVPVRPRDLRDKRLSPLPNRPTSTRLSAPLWKTEAHAEVRPTRSKARATKA